MPQDRWKRELVIAGALFAFGFFVLPFAIYWVGQQAIGDYAPDAGAFALAEHIWSDLLFLRPTAWILVAAPYAAIQLVRLVRRVWRAKAL